MNAVLIKSTVLNAPTNLVLNIYQNRNDLLNKFNLIQSIFNTQEYIFSQLN